MMGDSMDQNGTGENRGMSPGILVIGDHGMELLSEWDHGTV